MIESVFLLVCVKGCDGLGWAEGKDFARRPRRERNDLARPPRGGFAIICEAFLDLKSSDDLLSDDFAYPPLRREDLPSFANRSPGGRVSSCVAPRPTSELESKDIPILLYSLAQFHQLLEQ